MMGRDGSFVRWQATRIAQLGYAVNLILAFATASLGFALALVKDAEYKPNLLAKCLWTASVLLLSFSCAVGIWCVINRLFDFRKTAQNAKDREALESKAALKPEEIEKVTMSLQRRRLETDKLGGQTWALFYVQIGTFGIGAGILIAAFAVAFHQKIF